MSKQFKNLYQKIIAEDNLYLAYKKVLLGKNKYSPDAIIFAQDETYDLKALRESLENKTYKHDGYTSFYVYEPKERLIYAPSFKDKVVQIATNNILKQIYFKTFIYDSYGSIDNKGTHKCVDRISSFMRKAKWMHGDEAYVVKLDIKKFFYTIDRDILKKLFRKKIKCKDTLWLLDLLVDTASEIDDKGLPLGNTLSQLSSNIYLNEVDQFAKHSLRLKFYVRYMDDMIIIVRNKEEARKAKEQIKTFISDKLSLELNSKKSKIFPISRGVNAIGFKIHPTHRLLRNASKKKIKRKVKAIPNLVNNKKVKPIKIEQILNSWLGHANNASSYNFIKSLVEKSEYIEMQDHKLKLITKNLGKEGSI